MLTKPQQLKPVRKRCSSKVCSVQSTHILSLRLALPSNKHARRVRLVTRRMSRNVSISTQGISDVHLFGRVTADVKNFRYPC